MLPKVMLRAVDMKAGGGVLFASKVMYIELPEPVIFNGREMIPALDDVGYQGNLTMESFTPGVAKDGHDFLRGLSS